MFAVLLTAAAAQAQGSISGCVTDTSGHRVPGVLIAASGPKTEKRAVSQATGCYAVEDLEPGRYTVRALLVGFCPAQRSNVLVEKHQATEVNFTVFAAAPSSPSWAERDARSYWRDADAVVHVRVEDVLGTRDLPAPTCGVIACREYRAVILSVAKRHPQSGPDGPDFTFLQDYVAAPEAAYSKGDEFLAFLTWNASWRMFVRLGGPPSVLRVRDGRVVAPSPKDRDLNGITVEDFLAKLKTAGKGGVMP